MIEAGIFDGDTSPPHADTEPGEIIVHWSTTKKRR